MRWTRAEERWRDAAMRALLPADERGAWLPDDMGPFWERFMGSAPPSLRFAVRAAVWTTCVVLPLAWNRRLALTVAQRQDVLARMHASRFYVLRQLAGVLKLCACFAAFGHAPARARFEVRP